jgi:hypothetical protein
LKVSFLANFALSWALSDPDHRLNINLNPQVNRPAVVEAMQHHNCDT